MPIGPARLAEPGPGIEVNLACWGPGWPSLRWLPMLLVLPPIWRAARRRAPRPAWPSRPLAGGPSRLGSALGMAGSLTGGIGVRMALEPGRGRTAVPVRSALAGTALAVAAVVAAACSAPACSAWSAPRTGTGRTGPRRIDFMQPSTPTTLAGRLIATQPLVTATRGGLRAGAVNGQVVPAIGVDPVRGRGFLTLMSGRCPPGPGEIALGQRTLRATGARHGPASPGQHQRAGQARCGWSARPSSRPSRGRGSATDLGQGAVVAQSLLSTP